MSKYLYGASVQGIQEFIFKTNTLKEIVGASEIVKQIGEKFIKYEADEILVKAAGNIKAIFSSKEKCERVVLEFAKQIEQTAYGITISQAVVKIAGEKLTKEEINELERRLKIQRNKPSLPLDSSINLMKLNSKTAKPLVKHEEDKATSQKLQAYKEKEQDETYKELKHISNSKNKIAVVHIDGNGLGEYIKNLKTPLSEFSKNLDAATKEAFEIAKTDKKIREIILGGDDVTVICNANDALSFTQEFLENFENETEKKIGTKLTACAGIAFSNEKYPFHYAVSLAEKLCSQTKKHAKKINKKLAPSSLMFHNIQSSNFQSWEKFVADELTIKNDTDKKIRLDFGPYYLSEPKQPHIDKLLISVRAYSCDGSPLSRLRSWLSELHKSDKYAQDMLKRINDITRQSGKWKCEIMDRNLHNLFGGLSNDEILIDKDGFRKTPIYDILQIYSVTEKM